MDENIDLARQFLLEHFVSRGMVVDFAIHVPDTEPGGISNPHFHVMAPIRPIEENGKWGCKQHRVYELDEDGNRLPDADGNYIFNAVPTTDWGSPETLEYWREQWAAMKQKGESGEYLTTNPPYGYMKDPDNPKKHWIIDDEAAAVVRQIFAWCMEGYGPSQIAHKLKAAKVDCPTVHWAKMGRNAPAKIPDDPYDWAPRTISGILEKPEYLGHMVNFRTHRQSYKSKKKIENPQSEWKIFENTHDAIVDEETFHRVQELRKNKRRPARTGKSNMFSGVVRCADCGEKLYYCTSNSFESRQDHFVCSTSRKKGKDVCDTHFIRAVVLEEGTLQHMRMVISCVASYEDAFRKALGAKQSAEAKKELSAKKRTLQKSENRLAELDRLFKRIYEDMVGGKLSEARFQMLADDYEKEQAELREKIDILEEEIQQQEDQTENVDKFIRQAKKYLRLEKLTPAVLNDLVKAVYVHAPDNSSGHRVQDVEISYNYIGILPASLLYDLQNGKTA